VEAGYDVPGLSGRRQAGPAEPLSNRTIVDPFLLRKGTTMTDTRIGRQGLLKTLSLAATAVLLLAGTPMRVAAQEPVKLLFVYGSEKQKWIEDVTKTFLNTHPKTRDGRPILIEALPMGSGETVEKILNGSIKAHLISPASGAYLKLGNARAGDDDKLVKNSYNLVRSPVVIAMWEPMAKQLGWPNQPVGWEEIRNLAKAPNGWGSLGHSEWGQFKFGHTHPESSNSGLIAVFSQVYAAAHKDSDLQIMDVEAAQTARYFADIQKSIVHYGESTGFFGKQMFANGEDYLSAAVLYENMVVESYDLRLPNRVVAIYPKEGTFWSDHPVGLVERKWVGPAEREAGMLYIDFLRQEPQQVKAMTYGFRPGLERLPLGAPIDLQHGVNPANPKILPLPEVEVMEACLKSWKQNKKNVRLMLVLDRSGSMNDDDKLINARKGCNGIIQGLGERDTMGILTFSDNLTWVEKGKKIGGENDRKELIAGLKKVEAEGETALYDAIAAAHHELTINHDPGEILAIIVLTDGDDNKSSMKLPDLLNKIRYKSGTNEIRIFTIAYGNSGANVKVLKDIAESTKATAEVGQPENIKKVIDKIVKFF
jgi:Ca-activated chloride channel homolog